jgi:hypothetical protein
MATGRNHLRHGVERRLQLHIQSFDKRNTIVTIDVLRDRLHAFAFPEHLLDDVAEGKLNSDARENSAPKAGSRLRNTVTSSLKTSLESVARADSARHRP